MTAPKGIPADTLIDAWIRHGGSNRGAARELGVSHTVVLRRIRHLYEAGDSRISPELLFGDKGQTSRTYDELNRARR